MSSENAADLAVSQPSSDRGWRPEQPEPFLRGAPWPGTTHVPYPRADPRDRMRLPKDTWQMAQIPAGVRIELVGSTSEVEIDYETATDQLGYRGEAAGVTFSSWDGDDKLAEESAELGHGTVRLAISRSSRSTIHLPEAMRPTVLAVRGVDGDVEPAPALPRWVIYGDSVAEGWIASEPGLAWPARAGRRHDLDTVNLGYAGAARAEVASAEQVASLDADLFTVCHGTNCWTRIPHSVELFRAATAAFLDILRDAHPETPILVVSPVVRPDAESTPNRLGATLADLRETLEEETAGRIDAGDHRLHLIRGLELIDEDHLGDGIHPDDEGHRRMAEAIGARAAEILEISV